MEVEMSAAEKYLAADSASPHCGSAPAMSPSCFSLSPTASTQPLTINDSSNNNGFNKRKRRPAGTPDPDAEVVALSPRTLLESDRYICDICSQGFQRDQNLQMHRRRHKVPWKLLKRPTTDTRKRVYVCPEPTCLHHDPSHALGDLVGIKKHYRRKHSTDKQWKCEKCSKGYAVQSDYKAHLKTCGTRGHCCDCGRVFSRVESFIEHQDTCTAAKEKSALQVGGAIHASQANGTPADSPSSRSLSTDCLSVDPSRSAISDSVVMPGAGEYGENPVSSSSPSRHQHWIMMADSRELQLLPEETSATRASPTGIAMMPTSSSGCGRREIPAMDLKCSTPTTSRSHCGETAPRLQLSIGPYSLTEDAPSHREKSSTSMIGPALPDVYEVKPITVTERAALSNLHQHRLQRRGSEGKTCGATLAMSTAGSVHNLSRGQSSNSNGSDSGGIGDGLSLSGTSMSTTTTSVRECSDHTNLSSTPFPVRSARKTSNLLGNVKESSLLLRRKSNSRSPVRFDHGNNSELVVVPNSDTLAWRQASRQQNTPMTPTTPSTTTNGGGFVTDLDSATTITIRNSKKAVREQMEAAVRAIEEASRQKEMANSAREQTRSDIGCAWSDFAAARRTKDQARVEREEAESELAQAELFKREAREQLKLASAEKSYAEHTRENAKRQRELAESELISAKRVREQAQTEIAKAQMLKDQADRFMDVASSRFSSITSVAAVISNVHPSSDCSTQQVHKSQRPVPPSLDFTSHPLPMPNFSSTSSPFQISTPPRFSSSMIPVTFIGTSALCPPPMSLPPCATVCTIAASGGSAPSCSYSPSMTGEAHLHTPKSEMI